MAAAPPVPTPQSRLHETALLAIRECLPVALVGLWCQAIKYQYNQCLWDPVVTLLACIYKQLQSTASARQVEDWVHTFQEAPLDEAAPQKRGTQADGSDFCTARARLPLELYAQAVQYLGRQAHSQGARLYRGLRVLIGDGSTVRVPRTQANADEFGYASNAVRASRRPLVRLVLLVCAATSAVLGLELGPYRTGELTLMRALLRQLRPQDLFLGDGLFGCYPVVCLVRARGAHVLAAAHGQRRRPRLRRLGRGDALYAWPARAGTAWREGLTEAECYPRLEMRHIRRMIAHPGYRTHELHLVTTLLDPELYPADELVQVYLERWQIELDLRTLKTHYGMAQLTCKSPETVKRELYATVLAYNCIACLMTRTSVPVRDLSHTRARELVLTYSERMVEAAPARRLVLQHALKAAIATAVLDHYPRLPQPRALLQRPSTYPVLMLSRDEWRRLHGVA